MNYVSMLLLVRRFRSDLENGVVVRFLFVALLRLRVVRTAEIPHISD
jgi:hypothetical protein